MATALSLNKDTLAATFSGNLLAANNNTLNIGSSTNKFANIYATNFIGEASRLTGFISSNYASPYALNDATTNGLYYATGSPITGQSDGALYVQAYNSTWVAQIFQDYRSGQLAVRGKNNGTWQDWRKILDSQNYSSYALPLGGGTLTATNTDTPLYLKSNTSSSWIGFQSSSTTLGWLGFSAVNTPSFYNTSGKTYTLYHTGNLNPVAKRSNGGTTYTDLGYYYASGSTATYVRIAFPSVPSWTMCTMELTVRENYGSKYSGKLTIYANQSSGADWTITAVTHGTLTSNIKVYGSDKKYFYIKGIASWGGLSVDKMLIGDSAVSSDLTNLTIDGVSALPTTYQTATMYNSFTSRDIIPSANLPAATTSALGAVKVGSNISVSNGTISLTKANVTSALGYTPPDYTYQTSDPGAGSSLTTGKLLIVYS